LLSTPRIKICYARKRVRLEKEEGYKEMLEWKDKKSCFDGASADKCRA